MMRPLLYNTCILLRIDVIHWWRIKILHIGSDIYMLIHFNQYVQLIAGYLVHMDYFDLNYISNESILNFERELSLNICTCV